MLFRTVAAAALLAASSLAQAGLTAIDLSMYRLTRTIDIGPTLRQLPNAHESSAITYNRNSGSLFVIDDEGVAITQFRRDGTFVSRMQLTGFQPASVGDPEGLTWVGTDAQGRPLLVIAAERSRNLYQVPFVADTTVDRTAMGSVNLGSLVGNIGIEGVSFDPRDGSFVTVKEKTPIEVNRHVVTGFPGTAITTSLFNPAGLIVNGAALVDLADVQVLSTVIDPSSPFADHLLLLSHESNALLLMTRAGQLLGSFDLRGISTTIEGVTIDEHGIIYLTDETPNIYVLTQIPVPGAWLLMASGLAALAWLRRRSA